MLSRRMSSSGCVVHKGEDEKEKILVGNPEKKSTLIGHRRR
jgi:hypothetical protein